MGSAVQNGQSQRPSELKAHEPPLAKDRIRDHSGQRDEMAPTAGPGGDLNSGRLPSSTLQRKQPTNSLQMNQPGQKSSAQYPSNSHGSLSSKSKLPFGGTSLSGSGNPSARPPGPVGARSHQQQLAGALGRQAQPPGAGGVFKGNQPGNATPAGPDPRQGMMAGNSRFNRPHQPSQPPGSLITSRPNLSLGGGTSINKLSKLS